MIIHIASHNIYKTAMKTKIFFFLISNLIICNLLIAQNITNTLGTSGVFSLKDNVTTYLSLSQSSGNLSLNRGLVISNTTSSTVGVIYKGVDRFLHNYGLNNTFLGVNAGNFTMTGNGGNVAVGLNSFISNTTGYHNTSIGTYTLNTNSIGYDNTAIGYFSLGSNTGGFSNTAVGVNSLNFNSSGILNTAVGSNSLNSNTLGNMNTAMGSNSLFSNSNGALSTAIGYQSLYYNNANYNTSVGSNSMYSNSTGTENTAIGSESLFFNGTGNYNTALGFHSLRWNNSSLNTAVGWNSMFSNINGYENTALGSNSLFNNNSSGNTAVGYISLFTNTTGFQNTAVGHHSLQLNNGSFNTALGYNAGSIVTTGLNLTLIGIDANPSSPTVNDQVTLGNGFVTSLRCNVQTITSLSDARDKKNITELSLGLDFISKLKPRQFNWDKREWYDDNISDGSKMKETPTAGFIAQELDSAQTTAGAEWLNLVLKDNPEKWEATYGNLLPVMIKAIQELNEKCEGLQKENEQLKLVNEKLAKLEQLVKEFSIVKNASLSDSK